MGKSVIITGASGGIGTEIVRVFADNGYDICLCCSGEKSAAELEKLSAELENEKQIRTAVMRFDTSDAKQCRDAAEKAAEKFGGIDVLVNNAGRIDCAVLVREREEDYEDVISVNQKGTFFMTQAVGKLMKRQKHGSIVNVSSVAGLKGCPGSPAYAVSKGAVNALTLTAAAELAMYNVRVNAVAPGMIDAGMTGLISDDMKDRSADACVMKRLGTPSEVAEAVYFLASDKSSYITGQILRVDGGMNVR